MSVNNARSTTSLLMLLYLLFVQDVCVPLSRLAECISTSKQLLDASPLTWYALLSFKYSNIRASVFLRRYASNTRDGCTSLTIVDIGEKVFLCNMMV